MSLALQVQFSCHLFFYIAVKRLVALFTVAQFSVAQIPCCRFIHGHIAVAFFPMTRSSIALSSVAHFSVAIFSCELIIFPLNLQSITITRMLSSGGALRHVT